MRHVVSGQQVYCRQLSYRLNRATTQSIPLGNQAKNWKLLKWMLFLESQRLIYTQNNTEAMTTWKNSRQPWLPICKDLLYSFKWHTYVSLCVGVYTHVWVQVHVGIGYSGVTGSCELLVWTPGTELWSPVRVEALSTAKPSPSPII